MGEGAKRVTTLIAGGTGQTKRAGSNTAGAASPIRVMAEVLAEQRDRWILWLAPAAVAGAAAWLLAPQDPDVWLAPALLILGGALVWIAWAWQTSHPGGWDEMIRLVLLGGGALLAASAMGAGAAQMRAAIVAAAPYSGNDEPVRIEGWVIGNDASESGPRLRLLVRGIEGVSDAPRYVRIAVPVAGALSPGRAAQCLAVLGPPAGPMAPGAYDFARRAWFERLSATGFSYGRCRPFALPSPPSALDRLRLELAAVRADLSAYIQRAAPGRGGAIAAALITGDRSSIDVETNQALRDSGLGHLLSVSGLHMGVVGGLVFASLLWMFSLISPIALRWPVKKLAAIGALTALGAYLIVSGSSIPALRAFVMAGVAFGAILLDRPAISMRGLALAALIVVLVFPESVLEPGFQMSFAATMALVAMFEALKREPSEPALPTPGPLIGALQAAVRGIGGVILISLVAGFATDPFAIYHFQRFSIYSLPANLIAAPIMSFMVAPAAGVAAVLSPFGHGELALEWMASALDLIAAVGQTFGGRAEAVRALPQPPDLAFMLCAFAMTWACLWRGALRWLALAPFAACLVFYAYAPAPVLAFDADLRAVYARESGDWRLIAGRGRSTYARDRLGGMLGLSPPIIERLIPPMDCGERLCAWHTPAGARIALVRDEAVLEEACGNSALVIVGFQPTEDSASCARIPLIDRDSITRFGGGIVYETEQGLRLKRAWPIEVRRPWRMARPTLDDQA